MAQLTRKTSIVGIGGSGSSEPIDFPVTSVNGKTGEVTLSFEDLNQPVNIPNGLVQLNEEGKVPSDQLPQVEVPVTSVNNKTGAVTLSFEDLQEPVNTANGLVRLNEEGKVPADQLPQQESAVSSVNGKTGAVQLNAEDIGINYNTPNNPVTLNAQGKVPEQYLPAQSGGGGSSEPFEVGVWEVADTRPEPDPVPVSPTVSRYLDFGAPNASSISEVTFIRPPSSESPVTIDPSSTQPSLYVNGKIQLPTAIAENELIFKVADIDKRKTIDLIANSADFADKIGSIEVVFTQSDDMAVVRGEGNLIERMVISADSADPTRIMFGSKFYQSISSPALLTTGEEVRLSVANDRHILKVRRTDTTSLTEVSFLDYADYLPEEKFNVYYIVKGVDNGDGTFFNGGEIELGKELLPYDAPMIEYIGANDLYYSQTVGSLSFGKSLYYMVYNSAEKARYDAGLVDSYDNIKLGYSSLGGQAQYLVNDQLEATMPNSEEGALVYLDPINGTVGGMDTQVWKTFEPNKFDSVAIVFPNGGFENYPLKGGETWQILVMPAQSFQPLPPFVLEPPTDAEDGKVYQVVGSAQYDGKKLKTGDYVTFYDDVTKLILNRELKNIINNAEDYYLDSSKGSYHYVKATENGTVYLQTEVGDVMEVYIELNSSASVYLFTSSVSDIIIGSNTDLVQGKMNVVRIAHLEQAKRVIEIKSN